VILYIIIYLISAFIIIIILQWLKMDFGASITQKCLNFIALDKKISREINYPLALPTFLRHIL